MKYLKWLGFLLLGLILIYVLLCVVGPKNMNTMRTATMEASPAQAYNMYNNLEKWSSWSPWALRDTSMVIDYGTKKEGVGGSYKWKGDNSGSGSMEILVSQFYATNVGAIFGKLQKSGVTSIGKPCGLYFKWDVGSDQTDMAVALPVENAITIPGATAYTIPSGNALQIDYYGKPENSIDAHYAMDDYLKDYGLLSNPPVVEESVTDPSEEPDPSKWLTKITYYIAQ